MSTTVTHTFPQEEKRSMSSLTSSSPGFESHSSSVSMKTSMSFSSDPMSSTSSNPDVNMKNTKGIKNVVIIMIFIIFIFKN